jgi:predicted AAA+ superfamily ATPase
MLLNEELERIIIKQQEDLQKDLGVIRTHTLPYNPRMALIISGIRRCGKSTLARQFLQHQKPIYYLQFEDIQLADFALVDFTKLEESFKKILGPNGVFFFDEIQIITGWEQYIRNLVDKEKQVVLTGSNASMLSKELGTKLTGRHITTELYPFSYKEFLELRKKSHSKQQFQDYLQKGGFPEYLKSEDTHVLKNLFQDIFFRDVMQRNDLRNELAIKTLLKFLLSNIGKELSYNKLKQLIDVGSVNSISQFIDHFEQAYLLFAIKKYDCSLKKQLVNPKKIYCVDTGIVNENSFMFSENKGRLLENLVFIELKRKEKEIFYHKNTYECDFLIKEKNTIIQALQVCTVLNEENKKREIQGLLEAMHVHKLKEGLILTQDQEEELLIENKKILVKPIWKWLLHE